MRAALLATAGTATALLSACAGTPESHHGIWPSADRPIVIDRASKTVRFAGIVPIVADQRPMLEVLVCAPDSREHEALVMASVRPSHIHAALIALGARPGEPGGLVWTGNRFAMVEPTGPLIGVRLAAFDASTGNQTPVWSDAADWFTTELSPGSATEAKAKIKPRWIFTGSAFDGDAYRADTDGTIVGLVSFTTEVVGMAPAISEIDADRGFDFVPIPDRVPPFGTRVIVELRLLD